VPLEPVREQPERMEGALAFYLDKMLIELHAVRGYAWWSMRSTFHTALLLVFATTFVHCSPEPDPGPIICTVPVGKVDEVGGRGTYLTYVELGDPAGTCAVKTSTSPVVGPPITIGFLSGSSGYSIDARPGYRIVSAVPGRVIGDGASAYLQEGNVVEVKFEPDEIADGGPASYRMVFRMNADPDPAKWTVTLFVFEKS
jgi:hypothetical protein